jgi:hypothetical protein
LVTVKNTFAEPTDKPVTLAVFPGKPTTFNIAALEVVQVPVAPVPFVNVVFPNKQSEFVPVVACTFGLFATVTFVETVVLQIPFVTVYLIATFPVRNGVIAPVVASILTIVISALDQTPPGVEFAKLDTLPTHNAVVPVLGDKTGVAKAVITKIDCPLQPPPPPTVYLIVSFPADKTVRVPVPEITATLVLVLLHTPPPVAQVKVVGALPVQ